jgi:hypothetical protein
MQDDRYDEAHTWVENEKHVVDWPFPAYGRSIPYILGKGRERGGHLAELHIFQGKNHRDCH